ncbi:unnamed protein product [Peniophora sp. CBMAI 1063]|nr:unnamed protein product [Peniophora sp. CBMAI 1063]
MFKATLSLAVLVVSVTAQITINTPSGALGAIQCAVYQVTWTGGTGPFDLRLLDSEQNFVEEIASDAQSSPFQWTVNEPAGQDFILSIHDTTGTTATTGQFTIQPSSDTSCLNDTSSGDLTVNTPTGATSAIQCEDYQITWTGGNGPFDVYLLDDELNLVEDIADNVTSSPVLWSVNEPAGQNFTFAVFDADGDSGISGLFSIQDSSNSSCLNASSTASPITVNTPTGALGAIQCAVYQVTWTGGVGPFDIQLLDSESNFVEEIASDATSSPVQWTVNEPAGQVFGIAVMDSTGDVGLTGQFTIQPSSNSSCLGN